MRYEVLKAHSGYQVGDIRTGNDGLMVQAVRQGLVRLEVPTPEVVAQKSRRRKDAEVE